MRRAREGTHRPVGLDPVLEVECGTLTDGPVLLGILGELEDERAEGRVGLRLEEVALGLSTGRGVGREGGDENGCECAQLSHGGASWTAVVGGGDEGGGRRASWMKPATALRSHRSEQCNRRLVPPSSPSCTRLASAQTATAPTRLVPLLLLAPPRPRLSLCRPRSACAQGAGLREPRPWCTPEVSPSSGARSAFVLSLSAPAELFLSRLLGFLTLSPAQEHFRARRRDWQDRLDRHLERKPLALQFQLILAVAFPSRASLGGGPPTLRPRALAPELSREQSLRSVCAPARAWRLDGFEPCSPAPLSLSFPLAPASSALERRRTPPRPTPPCLYRSRRPTRPASSRRTCSASPSASPPTGRRLTATRSSLGSARRRARSRSSGRS